MATYEVLAKRNQDGSYSTSMPAGILVSHAFVDYYTDATGVGYQRNEILRPKRAKEIVEYMGRCLDSHLEPNLFELTVNARLEPHEWEFDGLDDEGTLGFLKFTTDQTLWLSVTDGGTRLDAVKSALSLGLINDKNTIDVRVFVGLSLGEEVAHFLLINEKQKRVRTDLSLRVVQRKLDDGELSDRELTVLTTVVPDTDAWRYEASRLASHLNTQGDSVWNGLIQMPNDPIVRPIKLQAFLTSLKPLLTNADLNSILAELERSGSLMVAGTRVSRADYLCRVIKNFWSAAAEVNPKAHEEPQTNVLWGSIGVSAAHAALAPILLTILQSSDRSLAVSVFRSMTESSIVADYDFWFSRKGIHGASDSYPNEKGDATTYTGAAGYGRLAKQLETEWRAALHSTPVTAVATA